MPDNFIKLYTPSSTPDCVYFLSEGEIFFYISDSDKYSINGKNLIVGSTELLLNNFLEMKTGRIETAVSKNDSKIKKMSLESFMTGIKTFSFVINTSMVLAKQIKLTNGIINKNMTSLAGDEKKNRESAIEYYRIVDKIKTEYEKRKFPWLKTLITKYEPSLTFKRGEAFARSSDPVTIASTSEISDKDVEYSRGTIICEENTIGDEMYILQSGAIDVTVGGNKVASIENAGTVIGEMALLLGDARTATLQARNNVILTKIKKSELVEIAERKFDILMSIALSLAKRHYFNVVKIGSLNKTIVDQNINEAPGKNPAIAYKMNTELRALKDDVEAAVKGKEHDFLKDMIKSF